MYRKPIIQLFSFQDFDSSKLCTYVIFNNLFHDDHHLIQRL